MPIPALPRPWPAIVVATAILSGCGGTEADKAAAPLPRAVRALGLDRLEWATARVEDGRIVLISATASTDGGVPLKAREVTFEGYGATTEGWTAATVTAEGVTGGVTADRVTLRDVSASRVPGGWNLRTGGRYVREYTGPLLGGRGSVATASWERVPAYPGGSGGRTVHASRLRLDGGSFQVPVPPTRGDGCDVSLSASGNPDGTGSLDLQRMDCPSYSLRGRFAVRGTAFDDDSPAARSLLSVEVVEGHGVVDVSGNDAPGGFTGNGKFRMNPPSPLPVSGILRLVGDPTTWSAAGIGVTGPGGAPFPGEPRP